MNFLRCSCRRLQVVGHRATMLPDNHDEERLDSPSRIRRLPEKVCWFKKKFEVYRSFGHQVHLRRIQNAHNSREFPAGILDRETRFFFVNQSSSKECDLWIHDRRHRLHSTATECNRRSSMLPARSRAPSARRPAGVRPAFQVLPWVTHLESISSQVGRAGGRTRLSIFDFFSLTV